MILVIIDATKDKHPNLELERLTVKVYPIEGQTVTTRNGVYVICETAIDYTNDEYIAYINEYE